MNTLAVGNRYPEFINQPDGGRFELTDSGAMLITTFYWPMKNEIEQFAVDKRFEIRFVQIHDVIMVTAKIGDFHWMDMPYTPHLSQHLTGLTVPKNDEGLTLQILLFDTATGELKKIRAIRLGNRFTKGLFKAVMDVKAKPFDIEQYDETVDTIYTTYTTRQLARMSRDYYRVNR